MWLGGTVSPPIGKFLSCSAETQVIPSGCILATVGCWLSDEGRWLLAVGFGLEAAFQVYFLYMPVWYSFL